MVKSVQASRNGVSSPRTEPNPRKLELPKHFYPAGFTREGDALYGTYEINKLPQFAMFSLAGLKKTSQMA